MIPGFDWKHPDYEAVFRQRIEYLDRIRANPELIPPLKEFYKNDPIQFIDDWGCTFDPRNVERGLPTIIPFVLFPRQRDFLQWVIDKWRSQKPGLAEKSRECGASWLAIALACSQCLFNRGMVVGFGSRKQEYVDKTEEPKSLFFKARMFMQELPVEFRGGWDPNKHAPHMRVIFPESGSRLTGEAGDQIGRGDRTSWYLVDESAFLERPQRVEASLSQTTNCRIDVSTPNGLGNPFEQKRHAGKIDVFTFHWSQDPRKGPEWYAKQKEELDPVVLAQEVDIDYSASVEGVIIPHAWIMSSIDADKKLGIKPTGAKGGALDVADEGKDKNAFVGGTGIRIEVAEDWTGKGDDIFGTVERAFAICDRMGYRRFKYDGDGLGAGVRGDARIINRDRRKAGAHEIEVEAFRGTGEIVDPEKEDVKGRKNEDFFANAKAQGWWHLRTLFQNTHRWVTEGKACDPDSIISLSSEMPNFMRLVSELSQPTYKTNDAGKIVVNKMPEGSKSPNLGDGAMMHKSRTKRGVMKIPAEVLATVGRRRAR